MTLGVTLGLAVWNALALRPPAYSLIVAPPMFSEQADAQKPDPAQVAAVLGLLRRCPGWIGVAFPDRRRTNQILAILRTISNYDTAAIRRAEAIYFHEGVGTAQPVRDPDDYGATIYVLNRYLFQVPGDLPSRYVPYYHGCLSFDQNGFALCPLQSDCLGRIQWAARYPVGGECTGEIAYEYDVVKEFDALNARFGRRHIPTVKYIDAPCAEPSRMDWLRRRLQEWTTSNR